MENLLSSDDLEEIIKKEGIDKKVLIAAIEKGEINPMVWCKEFNKMMPFRVTKFHEDDNSIEGYFTHEMQ